MMADLACHFPGSFRVAVSVVITIDVGHFPSRSQ